MDAERRCIMKKITRLEIALVLFLFTIILLPAGVLILTDSHVPYYPVAGEPVKDMLAAQGITLVSVQDTPWNMPGAMGGKTYLVLDRDGRESRISTQTFENEEARDAAIRSWHAGGTGRGRQTGTLFVHGDTLITVTPADRPVIETLTTYIKEK
jgi:hypothetical protein